MFECTSRSSAVAGDGGVEAKRAAPPLAAVSTFEGHGEVDALRSRLDALGKANEETFQQHAKMMSTLKEQSQSMQAQIESIRQDAQAQTKTRNGHETKEAALALTPPTREIEMLKAQSQSLQEEQRRQKELLKDMAASIAPKSTNVHGADADTNSKSVSIVEPLTVASDVSSGAQMYLLQMHLLQREVVDQMNLLQSEVVDIRKQMTGLEISMHEEHTHLRNNTCTVERAREPASTLEMRVLGQADLEPQLAQSPAAPELEESKHEMIAKDSSMLQSALPEGTRNLEETVWEVAIFIGLKSLGWAPTILALCCVILNACAQLLFCQIVEDTLTTRNMPSRAFLEYWRAQAHDVSNMDPVTGMSLVARVCSLDESLSVAGTQTSLIDNALDYTAGMNTALTPNHFRIGPTLFAVAWLLWLLCAVKEVMTTFEFIDALLGVPRGPTQLLITQEGFAIHQMSLFFVLQMILLQFARLYVCGNVFWNGSLWLANEMDLTNLMLNSAALSFIMDLDEMIYAIAMPSVMQIMASNLEPLRLPKYKTPCLQWFAVNLGFRPFFFLLVFASTYIWFYTVYIEENVAALLDAHDAVCKGEKDWVYAYSTKNEILMVKRTPPYTEDFAENARTSQQQVIQLGAKQMWNRRTDEQQGGWLAWLTPSSATFNEFSDKTVHELNQVRGVVKATCESFDNFSAGDPFFAVSSLARLTQVENATGCKSFVHVCGLAPNDWLRAQCPQQCGCDNPLSGLYFAGPSRGCPVQCLESRRYLEVMGKLACADVQPDPYYREMWLKGWRRYWTDFSLDQNSGGFWYNASGTALLAQSYECNILRDPGMRYQFCFASDDTTPLTKFCPVACGCVELPMLPGCSPSCKIYDHKYKSLLSSIPCDDAEAGFLDIELYLDLAGALLRRYTGSWKLSLYDWGDEFAATNLTGSSTAQNVMQLANMLGCDGLQTMWGDDEFHWFCAIDVFGISSFCPQRCGCTKRPTTMCPDKCFL